MEMNKWGRLPLLGGAAYSILTVAAAAAFPMPPGGDVSPGRRPGWLAAHETAVFMQGYVRAFAAISFIVFAIAVANVVRRRVGAQSSLPAAALVGGALTGLLLLASQAVGVGAALASHEHAGADTIRTLGFLEDAFLTLSSLPALLLFASAGLAFSRTRMVPRWLTYMTLAGVPAALVDAMSVQHGPFEFMGFLGLVFFLVWTLAASVRLASSGERPSNTGERGRVVATVASSTRTV